MKSRGPLLVVWLGLLVLASDGLLPIRAQAADEGASEEVDGGGSSPGMRVEPAFVEGYATSLLERDHGLRDFSLRFDGRLIEVRFTMEPKVVLDKLTRTLFELREVERVRFFIAERLAVDEARPADAEIRAASGRSGPAPDDRYEIFPGNELFRPLIADPRWPRFSAAYQQYLADDELSGVGAASFGETFPLVRSPARRWGQWEIAFQAGVFSVFDLDSDSSDLVNADYLVGLTASHHVGDWTTMIRVYHQSSHLGDEFLLRDRVDRINLSFEAIDVIASFEPWRWLRLYGGGGLLVDREPALDRGLVEAGIELRSLRSFADGYLRPLAALDVQSREESDWNPDFSLRAGFQIEHPSLEDRRLRLLGEFYDGRSPNGQFYDRDIRTVGVQLALEF